jgi:hypothetical protein
MLGRRHQLLIMSCIGKDVFYLKRGHIHELPGELKDMKKLPYIFASYWKARVCTLVPSFSSKSHALCRKLFDVVFGFWKNFCNKI